MQIQYNDPNSTYWKDKYKTLPNEVGPYAENKEKSPAWMRSKGLRYGGQDGGGHFWVSKSGDIYYFDDVAPGSNSDTENANDNNAGNAGNYTYSGNNILNTNAVTSPLQPIIYWPNNINSADITPRANPGSGGNYLPGHIANSSGITGKFGIVDRGGVTNYGSVPRDQVNSTTNEPYMESGHIKQVPVKFDMPVDCKDFSYFFIVPKTENDTDDIKASEDFFGYLNDRCGGIFKRCDDGRVILKKKEKDWNTVETSLTISKVLAHTVSDAIAGGTSYNEAPFFMPHEVRLWVHDPQAKEKGENDAVAIKDNNDVPFDSFGTGAVDVADYRNILTKSTGFVGSNEFSKIENRKYLVNEIIQASAIAHVIMERSTYVLYSYVRNFSSNQIGAAYDISHPKAVIRECMVINEMAAQVQKIDLKKRMTPKNIPYNVYFTMQEFANKRAFPFPTFYPLYPDDLEKPGAVIIIQMLKIFNGVEREGYFLSAEIYIDNTFKLPKSGFFITPK